MRGSVYRRGTTWTAHVSWRDGGHQRQVKKGGFRTRRDAEQHVAEVVARHRSMPAAHVERITVERFILDEWLPAKESALKPSTFASYQNTVSAYVLPRLGALRLDQVSGSNLNKLYSDLLTEGRTGASGTRGGLAPKTVRNIAGLLHKVFNDAIRWGRVAVNPCAAADPPRRPDAELRTWTPEQLGAFLTTASDDRHAAAWFLLATTGMRRGEVLGLRWTDLDLRAARVTITQTLSMAGDQPVLGSPKTTTGRRTIALDPATVAVLRHWRKTQSAERLSVGAGWNDHGLVVTEPDGRWVHPQVLTRRFHALLRRTDLPGIRLHDVRHSYATAAIDAGVPVKVLSQRLGHADIAVTLRIYAHVLPGDDEVAAHAVAARLLAREKAQP
jgi:integrase